MKSTSKKKNVLNAKKISQNKPTTSITDATNDATQILDHNKPKKQNPGELTQLLHQAMDGDTIAKELFFTHVKDSLLEIAQLRLSREKKGHTLTAAGLINECYLKLVKSKNMSINDRNHFFAIASKYMRQIFIDHARKVKPDATAPKENDLRDESPHKRVENLIDINAALNELENVNPRWAKIIEMRFFGQLRTREIAEVLDVSTRTVERQWNFARAWLYHRLGGDASSNQAN